MEGRELGPEKFQIRFQAEEDLERVLLKGPYHFKRWMLLLQKWEPVVSENFPSSISFWIRIHDIHLHFWNDCTITTIGYALGNRTDKIVEEAKVRVEFNGLLPLEMAMDIQLPSEEIIYVEFEYIKIEKHCFTCFSLFHEETDCAHRDRNAPHAKNQKLGITQCLSLQRIEAEKRRHDDRRGYQRPVHEPRYVTSRQEAYDNCRSYFDYRADPRDFSATLPTSHRQQQGYENERHQVSYSSGSRRSGGADPRVLSSGVVIRQQDILVDENPQRMVNNVEGTRQVGSIMSHPSPHNLRERMDFPTDIVWISLLT